MEKDDQIKEYAICKVNDYNNQIDKDGRSAVTNIALYGMLTIATMLATNPIIMGACFSLAIYAYLKGFAKLIKSSSLSSSVKAIKETCGITDKDLSNNANKKPSKNYLISKINSNKEESGRRRRLSTWKMVGAGLAALGSIVLAAPVAVGACVGAGLGFLADGYGDLLEAKNIDKENNNTVRGKQKVKTPRNFKQHCQPASA